MVTSSAAEKPAPTKTVAAEDTEVPVEKVICLGTAYKTLIRYDKEYDTLEEFEKKKHGPQMKAMKYSLKAICDVFFLSLDRI